MRLPRRVKFGLGPAITLKRVTVKEMKVLANCTKNEAAPDGLWDPAPNPPRIYILSRLSREKTIEAFFHELHHALTDTSYWVKNP